MIANRFSYNKHFMVTADKLETQ